MIARLPAWAGNLRGIVCAHKLPGVSHGRRGDHRRVFLVEESKAARYNPRISSTHRISPQSHRNEKSGFGWHLVFVDTAIPGRVPEFEEIEADVRTAWLAEQKTLTWDKTYKDIRAKYTVLLPEPPEGTNESTGSPKRQAAATSSSSRTP